MINELESWYKPLLDWGVLTDRTKSNIDLLYENNIVYPKERMYSEPLEKVVIIILK